MNVTATMNFAFPVRKVSIGAKAHERALSSRDYVARLVAAEAEDGSRIGLNQINWTYSESLDAPYAYFGASAAESGISFARELLLDVAVSSLVVELRPWVARSTRWSRGMKWEYVLFSGADIADVPDYRTTGLAKLEVHS